VQGLRTDIYIDSKHSNLNPNQKQQGFKLLHGFETLKLPWSTVPSFNSPPLIVDAQSGLT